MTALTTPEQIKMFQYRTLIQAIKLEQLGMHRRGKSARSIACQMLGLSKGTKSEDVILRLREMTE
jgi:hypothetical protein